MHDFRWFNHFSITVATPPSGYPVTPADCKAQSRIDSSADDVLLTGYIAAATRVVETWLRRALLTQQLVYTLDRFPQSASYSWGHPYRAIMIPRPPLQSIQSVQYLDLNGVTQTWDASNYVVDSLSTPGRLTINFARFFPVTLPIANAVTINYTAGYGTASQVPATIKLAISLLAAHWYENREPLTTAELHELPMHLQTLLQIEQVGTYP